MKNNNMEKRDINNKKQPWYKIEPVFLWGGLIWILPGLLISFNIFFLIFRTPPITLFLTAIGTFAPLVYGRIRAGKSLNRFKMYLSAIGDNHKTSIDQLASATQVNYATVVKDLNTMIKIGYLVSTHIDLAKKEVVQTGMQTPIETNAPNAGTANNVTTCSGCGATVTSTSAKCEYCGAPLR